MRLTLALLLTFSFSAPAGQPNLDRLRSPRALRADTPPQSLAELEKLFANPPSRYRSAPLWVWNDQLEWPRLRQQLEQFRDAGMGGAFIHPRPGLMTEYLSEEWFDLWRRSVDAGKQLGLEVHIYDENSYPAGFAGGHVPSRAPDTVGQVLRYEIRKSAEGLPFTDNRTVAIYSAALGANGQPVSFKRMRPADKLPPDHSAIVLSLEPTRPRAWTGGFPYVDLTNPRTTEVFLETTYEAYRRHVGNEFGRSIRWAFADEPELPKGGGWNTPALPYSLRIQAEFRRRVGYDLTEHLPSLYWDTGDFRQVRFDYWQLLHDLLRDHYFQPMFDWCDRNNLQWTGHWWEHLWPAPWSSPSDMSYYAFQHTPGIDMLIFNSRELFTEGAHPLMLFTVKQASSVANQLGRPRVLSESYGGGGWIADLEQFKRMGDWQLVHGVNHINQHLSYSTFRGARKRDWPQSFSEASAWWPYYRVHADHVGRASLAMSSGAARNRVLVLTPTTSAFLHARRDGPQPEFDAIREDTTSLVQTLADHQVDFDLGDEYLLEWFGEAEGKQLVVGRQRYDLAVWPKHMVNLRRQTVQLLERYLSQGGEVLALSAPAAYVDGRPTDQRLAGDGWTAVRDNGEILTAIRQRLPRRVTF
ncbi:MAG: hypothetical protein GY953_48370, partial [bacterium]|nr:hypothetical protein [bacterium]